jgi:hypothetical protein
MSTSMDVKLEREKINSLCSWKSLCVVILARVELAPRSRNEWTLKNANTVTSSPIYTTTQLWMVISHETLRINQCRNIVITQRRLFYIIAWGQKLNQQRKESTDAERHDWMVNMTASYSGKSQVRFSTWRPHTPTCFRCFPQSIDANFGQYLKQATVPSLSIPIKF